MLPFSARELFSVFADYNEKVWPLQWALIAHNSALPGAGWGVYTGAMRGMTTPITVAASLCLVALQLSGLHMHTGADGYVGTPQPTHTHSQSVHAHRDANHSHGAGGAREGNEGPADHDDYEGTRDIAFDELALSLTKLPLAILAMIVLFVAFPRVRALRSLDVVHPVLSGRHTRWRPELRAPPGKA